MRKYAIREPNKTDPAWIAPRLRVEDLKELEAAGLDPLEVLSRAHEASVVALTVDILNPETGEMEPAVMGGVASYQEGVGHPWMLSTPLIEGLGISAAKEARKWVSYMKEAYPVLSNFVHAKNKTARQWIEMVGFDFPDEPAVTLETGEDFVRFESRRPEHV